MVGDRLPLNYAHRHRCPLMYTLPHLTPRDTLDGVRSVACVALFVQAGVQENVHKPDSLCGNGPIKGDRLR